MNQGTGNDTLQGGAGDDSFAYLGSGAFTATGNSEARFNGSALLVDTSGDGTSDPTLTLTGITAAGQISNADFSWV